jgi:DNA topoisomerase IB
MQLISKINLPVAKWKTVNPSVLDSLEQDRLWQVYNLAYGKIGVHVPDLANLLKKYDLLWLIDVDGDNTIDAFIAYSKTPFGNKIGLMGSDGSQAAKKFLVGKFIQLLKTSYWYAEVSDKPALLALSNNIDAVTDTNAVSKILGSKGKLTFLEDGWYLRQVGALGNKKKLLVGRPKIVQGPMDFHNKKGGFDSEHTLEKMYEYTEKAWEKLQQELKTAMGWGLTPGRALSGQLKPFFKSFTSFATNLGSIILETKSIPLGENKKLESILRDLSETKSTPKDVEKWISQNEDGVLFLLSAAKRWSSKSKESDGAEVFKSGPFTIHNTIGAPEQELDRVRDLFARSTNLIHKMQSISPGLQKVLYGDIFVVGQIRGKRTAGWYDYQTDNLYIRVDKKFDKEVVRHLIHELSHRFWDKFMSGKEKERWLEYDKELRRNMKGRTLKIGDELPYTLGKVSRPKVLDFSNGEYEFDVPSKENPSENMRFPKEVVDRWMQKIGEFPTKYAMTKPEEHFCEVMSMAAIGKLHPDSLESLAGIFNTGLSIKLAAKYKDKKEVPKADGKGTTTVYEYSENQITRRNNDKAKQIEKLRKSLSDLRSQIRKDLKSDDLKTRMSALVVGLINDVFERVGNPESAKDGHFGVTGWKVKHVTFRDGKAVFRYVGKSGVSQEKETKDAGLIAGLKELVKGKSKSDDIFDSEDVHITSSIVNDYLKPFDITAKDIRGLHANRQVQTNLRRIRREGGALPEDKKKRDALLKKEFKQAVEEAAEAVGHEPTTLQNQYLVPGIEDNYLKDGTVKDNLSKQGSTNKVSVRLDKAWLMAVKRGWNQILKTPVYDFSDVIKVVNSLRLFIQDLKEQVTLVRRAWPAEMQDDQKAMFAAFDKLEEVLFRSGSLVNNWYINKAGLSSESMDRMLSLYKKDLDNHLGGVVKQKDRMPKPVPLTYHFDRLMRVLYDSAKQIKDYHEIDPSPIEFEDEAYRFFSIGRMKVVVVSHEILAQEIKAFVRRLIAAYGLLKKHGFDKVWYGTLFILASDFLELTDQEQKAYKNMGYDIKSVGGTYNYQSNEITLSAPSYNKGTTIMLLHELGHRYWYKVLDRTSRLRFEDWLESGLAPVSDYGKTNASEAFAEVFSYYCSGMNVSKDQAESFKHIVKKGNVVRGQIKDEDPRVKLLSKSDQIRYHEHLLEDEEFGTRRAEIFLNKRVPKDVEKQNDDRVYKTIFEIVKDSYALALKNGKNKWVNGVPQIFPLHYKYLLEMLTKEFPGIPFKRQVSTVIDNNNDKYSYAWDQADYLSDYVIKYKKAHKTAKYLHPTGIRKDSAISVTLNRELVAKLRKEFLVLVSNIKNINDFNQAVKWRKVCSIWAGNLEDIMVATKDELQRRAWSKDNNVDEDTVKYYTDSQPDFWRFVGEVRHPPYINSDPRYYGSLDSWKRDAVKWDRLVRLKAQKAWKWLNDFVDWVERTDYRGGGGELKIEETDEQVNIEGFSVNIRNFKSDGYDAERSMQNFRAGLRLYKQKAQQVFPKLLDHSLPIIADFSSALSGGECGANAGGCYLGNRIGITYWGLHTKDPKDMVKLLAHEMGHHLYKKIFSHAMESDWAKFIHGSKTKLDLRDIVAKWKDFDDIKEQDPILYLQLETLSYSLAYKNEDLFSIKSIQRYLDGGGDPFIFVTTKPVTGYSAKNSEEAFCEALGMLVAYGPRTVLPEVRHFLTMLFPGIRVTAAKATIKVWLDDERPAPSGWVHVFWPEQAIKLLKTKRVSEISLDHDLGDDNHGTGYTVLQWLEKEVVMKDFAPPVIRIHTANPSARQKMELAVSSIERHTKKATKTPAEKEDEAAAELVKPAPKHKPPRHDLRRERVQIDDPDVGYNGADKDRDLTLNYKRVAHQYLMSRIAEQTGGEHKPGDYWKTEKAWGVWPKSYSAPTSAPDEETARRMLGLPSKSDVTRNKKVKDVSVKKRNLKKSVGNLDTLVSSLGDDVSEKFDSLTDEQKERVALIYAETVGDLKDTLYDSDGDFAPKTIASITKGLDNIEDDSLPLEDWAQNLARVALATKFLTNPNYVGNVPLKKEPPKDVIGYTSHAVQHLNGLSPSLRQMFLDNLLSDKTLLDSPGGKMLLDAYQISSILTGSSKGKSSKGKGKGPGFDDDDEYAIYSADDKLIQKSPNDGMVQLILSSNESNSLDGVIASMAHANDGERRTYLYQTINNLNTQEFKNFLGNDDGPFGSILDIMDDMTPENESYTRDFLTMLVTDDLVINHEFISDVLSIQKNRKDIPDKYKDKTEKEILSTVDSGFRKSKWFKDLSKEWKGCLADINADCESVENKFRLAKVRYYYDWTYTNLGLNALPEDHVLHAQIKHLLEKGDASELDAVYIPKRIQ